MFSTARGRSASPGGAFSLVELLVVAAVIASLTALLVPAVRGLVGVGGRRGGMNMVSSTIEKARLAAIESGTSVYVGFPFDASDAEVAYSSLIVFRDGIEGEDDETVPLSRWVRMPPGIFIESDDLQQVEVDGALIPRLAGSNGVTQIDRVSALVFDRFGRLKPGEQTVDIRIGEKSSPEGEFRNGSENHVLLSVQPLTGRVIADDRADSISKLLNQ